jgi:serine protease Do
MGIASNFDLRMPSFGFCIPPAERMKIVTRGFLTLLAVLLLVGRVPGAPADSAAARRTPVVEVFQQWADAVACVTGPTIKDDRPNIEEFFNIAGMKPAEVRIGSGFVLHESGYVVTNAHAAEKILTHQVGLADGKGYPAVLLGSLHDLDLALLKIEPGRPLHAVRLARSGDLLIGETVIVIANPHGLMRTCTTGVVSAAGRGSRVADLPGVVLHDLIQTDAGINPGSSGGPWFNAVGEVIGMTASMKKDSENIGFALSAATLRKHLPELLCVGPRYGLTTGIALESDGPCRVTAVAPDSPAAKAGVRVNDVVETLDGQPTPTVLDFHLALIGRRAGQTLPLAVRREGRTAALSLTLAALPKRDGAQLLRDKLGLSAVPLPADRAAAMSLRVRRGLLITEVDPPLFQTAADKPAPGDVLARLAGVPAYDLDQVGLLVERIRARQPVPMVVLRVRENRATRIDMVVPAR